MSSLVRRLDQALIVVASAVAVVCLLVVGVTLFVSVVLRYVSGSSLPFATELPTYLFPWLVCAGIVAAAGAGGHLAVDYVVERMPAAVRRVVRTAMWIVVVVALVFIANSAWGLTASYRNQDTPILGWPAGLSYVAFPIALVALTIHAVGRVIAAALGLPSSQNVFAEADVDSPELSEVTR